MMSRANSFAWVEDTEEQNSASASLSRNSTAIINRNELGSVSACAFKPMLDVDEEWYTVNNSAQSHQDTRNMTFSPNFAADPDNLLLHPLDSAFSSSVTSSMFSTLDPSQVQYFPTPKPTFSSFLSAITPSNPLLERGFDMGCEVGFLEPQASTTSKVLLNAGGGLLGGFSNLCSNNQLSLPNLSSDPKFSTMPLLPQVPQSSVGFEEGPGKALVLNRSNILRPLESLAQSGAQPTLFQKRAALRENLTDNQGNYELGEGNDKKRKMSNIGEDVEDGSFDGSGLNNYDSDDMIEESNNNKMEENAKNGGNSSNANSTINGADQKGKKKGMPAKNLMAERRRRMKLNDRLYMLRSVVPNISKMDRASILGDAIEYLKELLQRISDLHNELESAPAGSSLQPASSSHPLTPTLPTPPGLMKEELCPSLLPSPNGQPARVEVRLREGRAVNIHMLCGRKPGLLLSTMRALDNLGLDIQQAVISYFNGFAMDIFRAEQYKEGQDIHPEQIKAVLLESAGFHSMI